MTTNQSTISRLGGLACASRHDPREYTRAAREKSHGLQRFLDQQPTELPEEERVRRAQAARTAFYVAIGRKGGQRSGRRGGGGKGAKEGK